MSVDSLFSVFDAWDLLIKARQPKGLAKWGKLSYLADSLSGKKSSDITFTTCYPGQEGSKKTLGSVDGNLHFLMGYANPAFHVAPYHFSVVDPNLSVVDASILYRSQGHPSRPELWERTDLEMKDEGDLIDGTPHPSVASTREMLKVKTSRAAESITVSSGTGSYTGIPSEGIVYGNHNKQVYMWEMVKESFFAAANPDLTEAMNVAAQERQAFEEEIAKPVEVPELVKHQAHRFVGKEFVDEVYPLVKSHFPTPSSIVPLEAKTGETYYGVVTPSTILFYDREGGMANLSLYDAAFPGFDLKKGGDTYSSILYSFGEAYFGIPDDLEQYSVETETFPDAVVLKGLATPGFSSVSPLYGEVADLDKSVVIEDGTYRLVVPSE